MAAISSRFPAGGIKTLSTTEIFRVSKYSKAALMPPGQALRSKPFDFHGRSWRIKVYPAGIDDASRDFVSIFLKCRTQAFHCFTASITMEILDRSGGHTVFDDATAALGVTAADEGFSKGYARFAKRRELEVSDCIGDDDSFTIRCTLEVGAKAPKPSFSVPRMFAGKRDDMDTLPAPRLGRFLEAPPAAVDDTALASTTAAPAEIVTGSQKLVIDQFSHKKLLLAFGECVRSRQFDVGGSSWYVKVYPNGYGDSGRNTLCCVLARGKSVDVETTAEFTFVLEALNGDLIGKSDKVVTHTFDRASPEQVGFKLAGAAAPYHDIVFVRCGLGVFRGPPPSPLLAEAPRVAVPPRDSGDFLWLLNSEEFSDVTFAVGGYTFRAHSCVLAAQSPVLRAELRALRDDPDCAWRYIEVDPEAVPPEAFEALLHVAYTDHLPDMDRLAPTDERVEAFVLTAEKYEMERLKFRTEEWVCTFVTVYTVAEFLSMAVRYDCQLLRDACVQFATPDHVWKLVKETEGFKQLRASCPQIVRQIESKQRQY